MLLVKVFLLLLFAHNGFSYTLPYNAIAKELVLHNKKPVKKLPAELLLEDLYIFSQLLNKPNVDNINAYLKRAHIDTTIVSQAIYENEPIFIIGALPQDKNSPQLWINKKDFVPVKEIGEGYSIIFSQWSGRFNQQDIKLPGLITITIGDNVKTVSIAHE